MIGTYMDKLNKKKRKKFRGVVPGGAMAPPDFGRSVNPISDYVHLITTGTPGFSNLPTTLVFCNQ